MMAEPLSEEMRMLAASAAALVGGIAGTWTVRAIARRFGIVNKPNPIVPQHTRPVAYLGGVGAGIGIACGALALWLLPRSAAETGSTTGAFSALAVAGPGLLFLILGVWDDLVAFKPAPKFLLQACVAALAVGLGAWHPLTGIGIVDRVIAWFWITTLVNAFNFTDVCDGLLGSLSVVMFVAIGLTHPELGPLAFVVAAACAGFLVFNRPPATIFLGDAGSHLLGFLAAVLTLAGMRMVKVGELGLVFQAGLLVAVPAFELTFLTIVRIRKGLAWWRGSPDHFSLRLQAGGFSRGQTDLIACTFAAAFAGGAYLVPTVGTTGRVALAAGALALSLVGAAFLLRWEVKPKPKPAPAAEAVAG